ncbi:MAG: DEAD/DEAH box helicase, partial [Halobacteriota archaeon]
EARAYQLALAESATRASTMIVLPTGLGKTIVALLVIAKRLENDGRVLFLAPTKPLVEQHAAFLRSHLLAETAIFTGEIPPDKRRDLWKQKQQAIVSTPQVIENDLKKARIDLSDVKLIIFDEAHRAVGNYAYRFIASTYVDQAPDPLILGMTASPGGTIEKIHEVSASLFIDNIEIRTESDPDVYPYTHEKNLETRKLSLPAQMETIQRDLKHAAAQRLRQLMKLKVVFSEWVSTSELIKIQHKVAADRNYRAMSLVAEVIKLRHAVGLIETQGIVPTRKYFERLNREAQSKKGSKAARSLVADDHVKAAMTLANRLDEMHPKLGALKDVVAQQLARKPDSRIIVFTNYRDTAEVVKNTLNTMRNIRAEKFVGQAKRDGQKGLSQREQVQLVTEFVSGTYNVIVATSVAEEGLDIPATDMVVFYEPIPSAIRSIQREGRTGRRRAGRVVVLVTKGTRDETYSFSSSRKKRVMSAEMKRMSTKHAPVAELAQIDAESRRERLARRILSDEGDLVAADARLETQCSFHAENDVRGTDNQDGDPDTANGTTGAISEEQQKTLLDFDSHDKKTSITAIRIVADHREARSGVIEELQALGAIVDCRTLPVADYVMSDRVAVERKTDRDFTASLTGRDLLRQIQELATNYERPIIVIEGPDLFTQTDVHPNAIRGMLAAITVDLRVPIIWSRDAAETAMQLFVIAEREQLDKKRTPKVHGKKILKTFQEQQEYVIAAIPSIGPATARALLEHFGSVETIFRAQPQELTKVRGIGKQTAQTIRKLASAYYETDSVVRGSEDNVR